VEFEEEIQIVLEFYNVLGALSIIDEECNEFLLDQMDLIRGWSL